MSSSAHAENAAAVQARADARLVEILDMIERRELNAALRAVTELTEEVPNFRAAQLVYADLLRFRTGGSALGSTLVAEQPARGRTPSVADQTITPPEFFEGLQSELKQRRLATIDLPPPGMVPSNFAQLSPLVRHAIAVDASRSRLYVFSNGAEGMQLIADFYVSVGRRGVHKREEGDQRTPLGVYFVGRQIPAQRLPELYGKGALTVNYPNDWDKLQGRTGSGIWLHGVPNDQYARLPQASDGCVVLANPDIEFLMQSIDRRTPVLIVEKIDWVTPQWTAQQQSRDPFLQSIERWQDAWRQRDRGLLASLYSPELLDAESLDKRRRSLLALSPLAKLDVQDMSVFKWSEESGEIRIVNLHIPTKASATSTVRQYWRKQGNDWQIFSEDFLS